MGLVKKDDAKKEEAKDQDAPEDPPVVKTLKEIDDKYLALERQYEEEVAKLGLEFKKRLQPCLEERKKILTASDSEGPKTGTPALSGFWTKALQNHPTIAESEGIQEWDEPVLEFLVDIEKANVEEIDSKKGFKLVFHFAENPYFTNTELWKEYITEEMNPYSGELAVKEIKSCTIEWKAGKDVTVEKVAKKVKGGGAKKAKQKQEKEQARPSFFRLFFRSLAPGMELTSDLIGDEDADDEEVEEMLEYIMDADHDIGMAIRDQIIPFAVRFYTGEAIPEGMLDGDDEDDEDDDEDDDSDDDDEDSDDEPPARGKGGKGKKAAAKRKGT